MRPISEEIIAEIVSPHGEKREILEYPGSSSYSITVRGEFGPFQSTLRKAVSSGYRLAWSADERLTRDWKKLINKTAGEAEIPEAEKETPTVSE